MIKNAPYKLTPTKINPLFKIQVYIVQNRYKQPLTTVPLFRVIYYYLLLFIIIYYYIILKLIKKY